MLRPLSEGSFFKPNVTVFNYRTEPKPANNIFISSWGKLAYKLVCYPTVIVSCI